jgi:hypothetical protein
MNEMRKVLKTVLSGRTIDQALKDDARAIKAIGESVVEKSYEAKKEYGYVTAKILPVEKSA